MNFDSTEEFDSADVPAYRRGLIRSRLLPAYALRSGHEHRDCQEFRGGHERDADPNPPAPVKAGVTLPQLSWVPPADSFDWIQLKSGEWLKGRIKAMQERELDFESEELDDLTFDWKDIRQFRSTKPDDVRLVIALGIDL